MSDIVIWCPNTGQGWDPDSPMRTGIGGSETAVIRVAEELVRRGRSVTVYAECEGVWRGVAYRRVEAFVPEPCDLFVTWRKFGPLREMADLAKHRWLWCHDIDAGRIRSEYLCGVKLLALSDWHAQHLARKYPGAAILRTANGIDAKRFERRVRRQRHRLIYAQSPVRGLDLLLKTFPQIRERYPDAELHIFYGFDLVDGQAMSAWVGEVEALARQPGVKMHGRVGQERLAEEYLRSDALVYPSVTPTGARWHETFCISVVEAQAAGCIPITTGHGALQEMNATGVVVDQPSELVERLFELWARPAIDVEAIRERGRSWATRWPWGAVADQWLREIAPPAAAARTALRVCCTAIVYDPDPSHARLGRMLDSTVAAGTMDWVLGIDRKSVDGTADWVRARLPRADVFELDWRDDFSYARNLTLERVPQGCDWWYWIDSDEILERRGEATFASLLSDLPPDVQYVKALRITRDRWGTIAGRYVRELIVRVGLPARWVDLIHETIRFDGQPRHQLTDQLVWSHDPDEGQERSPRNGPLIEMSILAEPERPRHWQSWALNETGRLNFSNAYKAWSRYLELRRGQADDDAKCEAIGHLAELALVLDRRSDARSWSDLLLELRPEWPEAHLTQGRLLLLVEEPQEAANAFARAIECGSAGPGFTHGNADLDCDFWPSLGVAEAGIRLGAYDLSLMAVDQALRTRPMAQLRSLRALLARIASCADEVHADAVKEGCAPVLIVDPVLVATDLRVMQLQKISR